MLLGRYIRRSLFSYCALLFVAFFAMQTLLNFSKEFSDIGSGAYHFAVAMQFVLMSNLIDLYGIFPYIALLSSLLALNYLHKNHEITVMQVSGLTMKQFCFMVFLGALMITAVVTAMGEGLGPYLQRHAMRLKAKALNQNHVLATRSGIWIQGDHQFFFINQLAAKNQMHGVTRYLYKGNRLLQVSVARSADFSHGRWVFRDVTQNQLLEAGVVKKRVYPQMQWPLSFNPQFIAALTLDPSQLSLRQYYRNMKKRMQIGTISAADRLAFWRRVFQPAQTLVMFFLAIPFALSTSRQSQTGLKVMIGVVFGFFCYFLTHIIGSLTIINQTPAWVAALIPLLILFGIGIIAVYFQANKTRLFHQRSRRS